ncbi:MAG: SRPBCC domain-containing protein [Jatrophihabitans sp.]
MTAVSTATDTQVYRVYIKAPAEKIWQAITDPEWTNRYGYTGYAQYDLKPGGALRVVPNDDFRTTASAGGWPCPDVIVDGEVQEADPPHRLVTTWRMLMDEAMKAEGFTTLTYEIRQLEGFCSLTVTHDLTGAPTLAAQVAGQMEHLGAGGGHPWVLSDLKSLLETGETLAGKSWVPDGTG